MTARSLLRDCIPPALVRLARRVRPEGIRFTGDFNDWQQALADASGYDADDVLDRVIEGSRRVRNGEACFERDSVVFHRPEIAWPMFGGLMWAAARDQGRLNVLDFGGSLGSLYFQHRGLLERLPDVGWNIVEQAHFVKCGKHEFQTDILRFHDDMDACESESAPNVILLSSVLQYLPDPASVLERLSRIHSASTLIIDRTPVGDLPGNRLTIQHVPASIYRASYPMWILSEATLSSWLAPEWRRVHREPGPEGASRTREGLPFRFEYWLLERAT